MPAEPLEIDAVVFDVLGTLVDEPGGIRAAIGALQPAAEAAELAGCAGLWQEHVAHQQQRIIDGARRYADSAALDREAAELVAARLGVTDRRRIDTLATAGQRLAAWPGTAAGLDRIAARHPLLCLSNASRTVLLRLTAHAGLRWHQALSAADRQTYKPAPGVYQLAIEAVQRPPHRLLMVASHAWDLRGAQAAGMRTAYLHRAACDPPVASDTFDRQVRELDELADILVAAHG